MQSLFDLQLASIKALHPTQASVDPQPRLHILTGGSAAPQSWPPSHLVDRKLCCLPLGTTLPLAISRSTILLSVPVEWYAHTITRLLPTLLPLAERYAHLTASMLLLHADFLDGPLDTNIERLRYAGGWGSARWTGLRYAGSRGSAGRWCRAKGKGWLGYVSRLDINIERLGYAGGWRCFMQKGQHCAWAKRVLV